jgi:phosphatidylserine/phosphatidylglycerophosphate/cardiolipin synthase-like enzyme
MRKVSTTGPLSVRAISGSHVVILAWDVAAPRWAKFTKELLGFAIERTELKGTAVVERYWLRGMKRFEEKDAGAPVGSPFPTSEHPVQSFQWGDYSPAPGRTYRYRIVPVRGKPKNMALDDAASVTVVISTEPEDDGKHGIWFNRGVAASQAYARKFGDQLPDPDEPTSEQMKWLSRGLYEALLAFIGKAKGQGYALHGAFYEFRYSPVLDALKAAVDRGVTVEILYDSPNYGDKNEAAITTAHLKRQCKPRAGSSAEKHNKFLVLQKHGKTVGVWTGSTNLSEGGIFGHSNVGHAVWDGAVAQQYLDYWQVLWDDLDAGVKTLKPVILAATPTPEAVPPDSGITVMFSPRGADTLDWYASLMASAQEILCFTAAFAVSDVLAPVLEEESDVLRYVLKDKPTPGGEEIVRDDDLLVAVGSKFEEDEFPGWLGEKLTGFNRNQYIHDKFMLVDPLSDDPIVVTGSANFSKASMASNDENMLVIRGDTRVADIYFGEFMRLFDHLYARYLVKRALRDGGDVSHSFLRPDNGWVARHAGKTSPKAKRRLYFRG